MQFRPLRWGAVKNHVIRRKLPLRCLWLTLGLTRWYQAVKRPRLYIGDVRLARDFARCSPSSIYRAKKQLEQLHLISVMHTRGGSFTDEKGERTAAATGYEIHPDAYGAIDEEPRPAAPVEQLREPADEMGMGESLQVMWARIQARRLAAKRAGP